MFRCRAFVELYLDDLMDVAIAMLDGSYWREDHIGGDNFNDNVDPADWG